MARGFGIEIFKPMNESSPDIPKCDIEIIKYDPKEFGSDCEEELEVHLFKLKGKEYKNSKALIYIHGGGACMGCPEEYYFVAASYAVAGDMPVFSIRYRLGPEHKCPAGIMDSYAALKWLHANAEKYGVDTSRIGINGVSGGAWIASGLSYHLAKNDESNLVKTIFLHVPQLYKDNWFKEDGVLTEIEKHHKPSHLAIYEFLTGSKTKIEGDYYSCACDMGDEMLAKIPPHVFLSCEFDFFITDTLSYIE